MNLSLEAACGGMKIISEMGRKNTLDGLGISDRDFAKLVGDEQWLAGDRNRMATVLHSLVNASLDHMGIARFPLSAEYMAAGICMFVAGVNVMSACEMISNARPVEDLARNKAGDVVSGRQIFALVQMMYDRDARSSARALFEKNTGIALDKVMKGLVVK